ncbi:MAG: MaoC family dehydratase [Acidobacteriota bacterium]
MTTLPSLTPGHEAVSDWLIVSQARINAFAEATEDRQWVHIDVERAKRESPYGAPIAHGFLTLSLVSHLLSQALTLEGVRMGVNYGLNRVRFIAPVIAGSRIRGRFVVTNIERKEKEVKITWTVTIEREAEEKPCCVAEWLTLHYEA